MEVRVFAKITQLFLRVSSMEHVLDLLLKLSSVNESRNTIYGRGNASTSPILVGHAHPPDFVGLALPGESGMATCSSLFTAPVTRQAIPSGTKESQEITTIKCYQVSSQPWANPVQI